MPLPTIVCPLCGCAKPVWDATKPTTPGMYYYWDASLHNDQFLVVQVAPAANPDAKRLVAQTLTQKTDLYFHRWVDDLSGEWIGPLPQPKKRR